jgi:hypothetical protein
MERQIRWPPVPRTSAGGVWNIQTSSHGSRLTTVDGLLDDRSSWLFTGGRSSEVQRYGDDTTVKVRIPRNNTCIIDEDLIHLLKSDHLGRDSEFLRLAFIFCVLIASAPSRSPNVTTLIAIGRRFSHRLVVYPHRIQPAPRISIQCFDD